MSRRHIIGAFLACLCVVVMPSQLEAVKVGGFIESSEMQSGSVNLQLGGLETVKRWNSPDGSKWILMRKPGGTHDQLTHLYNHDGVQYQTNYFVGPSNPNCGQEPCRRIACDLERLEVGNYSCRVSDIAFDTEDTLMIVGTSFKADSRLRGFVARYQPGRPQTALRSVAVDGFDVSFQRIVRHEVSGNYIVSGNTFSSFDNEQRVIVGRLTSGEFMQFDGTFDGDGLATIDLGDTMQMGDVLVNPDGSVDLLALTKFARDATPLSVVRRLTSLGKPNKNFGLGGSAYPYGLTESYPVNLAAGPNSLYVLVKTWDSANQYYVPRLTRLTATGGYDTKFRGDGKADFKAFTRRTADIQENYKVRATTTSVILLRYLSTAPSLLQLYRLTATGEIDETFGCCLQVGWAEPDPINRLEWRDADVADDGRRIYLCTVTARTGGISVDARDYVLYSKTIDAVGAVPAVQDPGSGSTTTVVGQTPASGATGSNEGSTTDLAATTVGPAKDLVVRPLVRGL